MASTLDCHSAGCLCCFTLPVGTQAVSSFTQLRPACDVCRESGAELLHAVVELCFTSSVRFLQPGLLLKVRRVQLCGSAAVLDPEWGALGSAVGQFPWHGMDSYTLCFTFHILSLQVK